MACASVRRSVGIQPPSGTPSGEVRVVATCRPSRGSSDTTGQSLPKAMCAPLDSRLLYIHDAARARLAEVGLPDVDLIRRRAAVVRLLRRDHAERAEARDVRGVDGLDVLDAVAAAAGGRRIGLGGVLEGVERRADAAIADRVDEDLPAALVEHRDDAVELGLREVELAAASRGSRTARASPRCATRRRRRASASPRPP